MGNERGRNFEYEVDGPKPSVCFALISCPLLLLHVLFKTFFLVIFYDAAPWYTRRNFYQTVKNNNNMTCLCSADATSLKLPRMQIV